eukprot:4665096-Amphidinium_carterae.2
MIGNRTEMNDTNQPPPKMGQNNVQLHVARHGNVHLAAKNLGFRGSVPEVAAPPMREHTRCHCCGSFAKQLQHLFELECKEQRAMHEQHSTIGQERQEQQT